MPLFCNSHKTRSESGTPLGEATRGLTRVREVFVLHGGTSTPKHGPFWLQSQCWCGFDLISRASPLAQRRAIQRPGFESCRDAGLQDRPPKKGCPLASRSRRKVKSYAAFHWKGAGFGRARSCVHRGAGRRMQETPEHPSEADCGRSASTPLKVHRPWPRATGFTQETPPVQKKWNNRESRSDDGCQGSFVGPHPLDAGLPLPEIEQGESAPGFSASRNHQV